jgi:hypothetical protein
MIENEGGEKERGGEFGRRERERRRIWEERERESETRRSKKNDGDKAEIIFFRVFFFLSSTRLCFFLFSRVQK